MRVRAQSGEWEAERRRQCKLLDAHHQELESGDVKAEAERTGAADVGMGDVPSASGDAADPFGLDELLEASPANPGCASLLRPVFANYTLLNQLGA